MSLILDAATVGIIAIFALSSYRKGFLHTIVVLLGSIGAMFASLTYSQPLAEMIYQKYLYDRIATMVTAHLDQFTTFDAQAFANSLKALASELPAVLSSALQSELGINLEQWYQQVMNSDASTITAAITDTVVAPLAVGLVRVVVFFIMFSVLMMLVNTIAGLLRTVNHIPLIGSLNEILGGVLGAIQGMLYVFVISAVMWFIISAAGGEFGPISNEAINQTAIFRHFYTAGPWVDSAIKLI